MDTTRKFKFKFLIITEDVTLIDQNVWSWTFINNGDAPATINNNFFLAPKGTNQPTQVFSENLNANEKTAQSYKIVFNGIGGPGARNIQCIMKVEVKDK